MSAQPSNLLWDLDLDLDLDFQDQAFNFQDDPVLYKDPLKESDPPAFAELETGFGTPSLESVFNRPLSPLFKDLPDFSRDDERALSGGQANRSGSGNSTDEPGQKNSRPKRNRKPQKVAFSKPFQPGACFGQVRGELLPGVCRIALQRSRTGSTPCRRS